jgi:hypothetical protein
MNYIEPPSQDLSFGALAKPKARKHSRKSMQEFAEATIGGADQMPHAVGPLASPCALSSTGFEKSQAKRHN